MSPRGVFVLVLVVYLPMFFYFFSFDTAPYGGHFPIRLGSDGPSYAQLAENLLNHHVFSSADTAPFTPNTFRVPGYPLFVAGIIGIAHNYAMVSVVQIVLTALTTMLIFLIAQRLMSVPLAYTAALLYGFGLNTVTLSVNLMSEVLFIFLIIFATHLFLLPNAVCRGARLLGIGALLGGAILVRPVGLFIPVFFVLFLLTTKLALPWRRLLLNIVLFVVGTAIILAPWVVRNVKITGQWSLTSAGMYNVLLDVTQFLADTTRVPVETIQQQLVREAGAPGYDQLLDLAYANKTSMVVISHLTRYPLQYTKYHLMKFALVFAQSSLSYFLNEAPRVKQLFISTGLIEVPAPNINQLFIRGEYGNMALAFAHQWPLLVNRLWWIAISMLMVVPVFSRWHSAHRWLVLFCLVLILYLPFIGAPIGEVRYRVPAEPFMLLLAALGATDLRNWWKARHHLIMAYPN